MNTTLNLEPVSNSPQSDLFGKIAAFLRLSDSRHRESSSLKEIASDFTVSSNWLNLRFRRLIIFTEKIKSCLWKFLLLVTLFSNTNLSGCELGTLFSVAYTFAVEVSTSNCRMLYSIKILFELFSIVRLLVSSVVSTNGQELRLFFTSPHSKI